MLSSIKRHFRIIDFLSALTLVFIWLKSSGYYNGQASTIIVVVFWTLLREYVSVNSAQRHLKVVKTGRNGGYWVIIWYLFAGVVLYFNFINPSKYNFPGAELTAGLIGVTEEYIRSKVLRGRQGTKGESEIFPSNLIIIPSLSVVIKLPEE